MKKLTVLLIIIPSLVFGSDFSDKFFGEVAVEHRYFLRNGAYENPHRYHNSVVIKPEYSSSWDDDRNVLSIIPFVRIDQYDSEHSHVDIREFSLVSSWTNIELRLGISKVFWGVTESQHLVDIINQTDLVENPDGEQKLGQPMINPTLVSDAGNIELYILPYFRERTFTGEDGRYRGPILIDTDRTVYTDSDKNRHIDYAMRWSSSWRDIEWAVSYFKGTDREPDFRLDNINNTLIPVYGQSKQYGLELQYIYKDLLVKAEYIHKNSSLHDPYFASTSGVEYTFSNIFNGMDIGLLYEWLYDSRGQQASSGLYDASFYGVRLALNDVASSHILFGAIYNNQTSDMDLFRLEASRRIGQSLNLGIEANIIGDPPITSALYPFHFDDYIQLKLTGYF